MLGILFFAGWWARSHDLGDVRAVAPAALQSPVNIERMRSAFMPAAEVLQVVEETNVIPSVAPIDVAAGGGGAAAGQ